MRIKYFNKSEFWKQFFSIIPSKRAKIYYVIIVGFQFIIDFN